MPTIPVVFIHGLWMHRTSWQPWEERFAEAGYAPVSPPWPGEPATVVEARANPAAMAGFGIAEIARHLAEMVEALPEPPILVGHSFGGLFVQKLLGQGLGRAGVAIDPAQMKGVLLLPPSVLRATFPVLSNPANRGRAVQLTKPQFRYAFGNAVSAEESDQLHDRYMIPSPMRPLFQGAVANFVPGSPAAVDTGNATRGPLLMISGLQDRTVPDAVTRAAFKRYAGSPAVTELRQFDRGHSIPVDSGWREVADSSLEWLAAQGHGPTAG